MRTQRPFRLLLKIFLDRFFENDAVSPGGGFQTNIYQVLGILVAVGVFVSYFVMPVFVERSLGPSSLENDWALRSVRLFFTAYSFGVAGFVAVFHWDMLFPDRRDFLVLVPFPIRLRELIAAKFAALALFLLLLIAAVNLAPDAMVLLLSLLVPKLRGSGLRLALAQITATTGASAFAFFAVAAFQGVLISVTSPQIFRRVSPWIQMLGMSAMVLTVVGFPVSAMFLRSGVEGGKLWPDLFPPVWFSGLYELFLAGPNRSLASLGIFAGKMLVMAMLVISLTWGFGFRRHFRRTLEAEDTPHRHRAWRHPHWLVRSPQEGALFGFIGKTLARSQKHQFFLATYLSIGLSIALVCVIAIRGGRIVLSPDGVRSFAFIICFFVVSGFRAGSQFPAELSANWTFRITEARWTEVSRSATRKLVLISGLLPALVLVLPLELASWNWWTVLQHSVVQLMSAALLVELMFWSFDKVPFTCSYFPGRTNLSILAGLYLYGVTAYSSNMADLEKAIERHGLTALLFFIATAALLSLSWRRHPVPARFASMGVNR